MERSDSEKKNILLLIGGYINYMIAVLHIVGLLWADWMFRVTGIEKDMAELAEIHVSLPYLLTIVVAVFFYLFGRYALSAAGSGKKLPFLKIVNYSIAFIYLLRGIGEFFYDNLNDTSSVLETSYSMISIIVGLLYLVGTYQVFNSHKSK
ncbi:MAG: hypothetical protein D8M58_21025 [Calditrichaeota bacterium]|nr:MAG: hypothetical protein DWQ03_16740 [Calditrichota bacterium]MBL1207895.1 hypothetical protein [Calditrichota bacterium]NOG47730.1 hypothetical protein [Calditrichota bacterium]